LKKKVIFLGGKEIGYECLKLLFKQSKQLNIEIIGVDYSPNGKKTKEFSKEFNLKYLNGNIPQCNIIISVQYHRILLDKEIKMASERAVNLHMAPLPEYRGCNQFSFAIIDGIDEFGTTLHEIVPGIDSGPIISEKRFKIAANTWVKELFDLTYYASLELFKDQLPKLISGEYIAIDQNSLLSSRKTSYHFRKEIDSIKKINLNWSEGKISKYLRATMMPGFEPPYAILENKKVYFCIQEEK
jgi:methionyl-tRNA formyltransferase